MRDVKSTKSIVERIKDNTLLQTDELAACTEELLHITQDLDSLVAKQEEQTENGKGFKLFVHDFVKGPDDQQKLEAFRDNLVASKNTLTLAIVVSLSPTGTVISVSDTKLSDKAYVQNILTKEHQSDKGSGQIIIKKVELEGTALLLNTTLTPQQLDKVTNDNNERKRMEVVREYNTKRIETLSGLLKEAGVEQEFKQAILNTVNKLLADE